MATRHEEGCYKVKVSVYCLVCNGLSIDDVVVARGTVFQEVRPGAGFKTGDFVEGKLGGLSYNDSPVRVLHLPQTSSCEKKCK